MKLTVTYANEREEASTTDLTIISVRKYERAPNNQETTTPNTPVNPVRNPTNIVRGSRGRIKKFIKNDTRENIPDILISIGRRKI